jgi:glutaredoxin
MKEVKMFMFDGCPHCRNAKKMIADIFVEHPEYADIPFNVIDENKNPEIAAKYDYYYVPTIYTGDEKIMEGVPTKGAIEKAFAKALKDE